MWWSCASSGAASDADALRVAKAIAHSPAGEDGVGRLRSQLGTAGRRHRLLRRTRSIPIASTSTSAICPSAATAGARPEFDEAAAHAYISQREFSISIQLHQGQGSCVFWTTDLTHEYIHINADYST